MNLLYSTPSCYTYHVNRAGKTWTTKEDDFFPIAQQPYSFWAGYFTSRPSLKGYVRSTNNFLQVSFCSCAIAQKRCSWLSVGFSFFKTFSRRIAHYGMIGNFSLPATSAAGGGQALCHSWTRRTLVCSTNVNNSAAELLIVKWIQLLLVFSWGFQPPQRVINLDPAF